MFSFKSLVCVKEKINLSTVGAVRWDLSVWGLFCCQENKVVHCERTYILYDRSQFIEAGI